MAQSNKLTIQEFGLNTIRAEKNLDEIFKLPS